MLDAEFRLRRINPSFCFCLSDFGGRKKWRGNSKRKEQKDKLKWEKSGFTGRKRIWGFAGRNKI